MKTAQVDLDWRACTPMLDRALSYDAMGGYRLADIKAEVEEGRAHFWRWPMEIDLQPTACAVTNFVNYPRAKALNYWLLGGDMQGLRDMLPLVEQWGLMQGCSVFMGEGRRGFERAFAQDGYRAAATLYLKEIPMGRLQ